MALLPCITKHKLDSDLESYLHRLAKEKMDAGMPEKEAYLKTAKDLQEHALNQIHDIYHQAEITGYEKPAQPIISEKIKNKFSQFKSKQNASTQSSEQQQASHEQGGKPEHARTEQAGSERTSTSPESSNSNLGGKGRQEEVTKKGAEEKPAPVPVQSTVVYHGSDKEFSEFKTGRAGLIYLSEEPGYAQGHGKNLKEINISPKNVADLTNKESDAYKEAVKLFNESGGWSDNEDAMDGRTTSNFDPAKDESWELIDQHKVAEELKKMGYDAIKMKESSKGKMVTTYAVFDNSVINNEVQNKSTIGLVPRTGETQKVEPSLEEIGDAGTSKSPLKAVDNSVGVSSKSNEDVIDDIEKRRNEELDRAEKRFITENVNLSKEIAREKQSGRQVGKYYTDQPAVIKESFETTKKIINEKYDAELATLKSTPSPTVELKQDNSVEGKISPEPVKRFTQKIAEKAKKELDDLWDDFSELTGKQGITPDPEAEVKKHILSLKIIAKATEAGIYKLADIVAMGFDKLGKAFDDIVPYVKKAYLAFQSEASDDVLGKMDNLADVRKFDYEKFKTEGNANIDTTTGGTETTPLDKTGKGVDEGQPQGTVPTTIGQGRTDKLGDQKSGKGTTDDGQHGKQGQPASEPGPGISEGESSVSINGNEKIDKDLGGESKEQPIPKPEEEKPIVTPLQHNGNFIIPPDFTNSKSFNVAHKLQDNIDALKVLIALKNEGRKPTYEEQKALFKYVGWGGIKEIGFDPESESGWVASNEGLKPQIREVHDLLKQLDEDNYKENLAAIKSSTLNAHYTAIPVIRGIYNVIRKAGFRGGRVIEPSAGIGHFIGAMPIDMHEKSNILALEKDNITGEIFKGLYPNVLSRISGLEENPGGANEMDLVVSNIPFGNYAVFDPNFERSKDKTLRASTKKIHSYFFARAINMAKPNGLIAFITSTGILDSKDNADLRKMMADKTEFLGAIRLPNDSFKGNANTSVTTDIIFLRKLGETENPEQKHDFLKTKKEIVKHKNKNSDQQLEVTYNKYFHDNPDMILGKVEAGSMYGKSKDDLTDAMTVTPTGIDLEKGITDLADKIAGDKIRDNSEDEKVKSQTLAYVKNHGQKAGNLVKLPDGTYGIFSDEDAIDPKLDEKAMGIGINPNDIREDNLHTEDYQKLKENGLSPEDFKIKQVTPVRIEKKYEKAIKDLIPLRSALNELYAAEYGDMGDDFIEGKRSDLNKTYKTFVKNNGTLFENKGLLEKDVDGHNMLALENVSDKKVTGLADIFTKRVFQPQKRAESASDIADAISLNLSETGSLDLGRLSELLKKTPEEIIKLGEGIMFKNPTGDFETKDKYLSGNVRKKLEEAKIAAAADPAYQQNVKALEEVQPVDLNASQIYAPISAPWIATKHLETFASQLLKQNILINKLSTGRVNVDGRQNNTEVSDIYGTSRKDAFELLEEVIQNRMPIVTDTIDKKSVVNEKETAKAVEKAEKIKKAFDNWIWLDDARRNELVNHYNQNFNAIKKREYDGSHLKYEGYAGIHTPRPHQNDAVWMVTQQLGGILDHIVGSGKSLIMALAANKMKKMGLIKKPIITGLKANAEDLATVYKNSFPLAKVLYPKAKDFTPENRKAFFAKIANNDWDAIVMTHDQFGMIAQSKEIQQEIIGQELESIENDIRNAKDNNMSKRDLYGLEVRKNNLEVKLLRLASMKKDPSLKSFDEMGIDFMFVDESQQFKNLQYGTIQRGVAGLGDPTGSAKAFNMLFAIRTLQKMWGGDKGTVFASGTPISNTMVEMYLLFKYLQPNKMAEMGINSFDNWANTFARVGSEIEFGVTNSLKPKTRMREFMNVPEMAAMYREIADVRNDSNLDLQKPKFKQTYRFKTDKEIANGQIVTIGDKKFKSIGKIKGLEKNEYYVSLMALQPDEKLPSTGQIDYEGGKVNYSEVTNSDGLLVNVAPTPAQRKFAKAIQKFAETKDGSYVGIQMDEKKKKAVMLLATNLAAKMAIDMRLIDPSLPGTEVGKLGVAADTIAEHYKESDSKKGVQLVFSDLGTPKAANTQENLYDLLESRGIDADTLLTVFGEGAKAEKPTYPKLTELKKRIMDNLEYSEEQYNDAVIEANEDHFNVYQDMKDKLVKRGIPADEIAFIHDYKTDAKRKQLFEDARSGKIRIILGSTAKLGTGVNVQDKVVAMHHLDVPWRPSDMEQRNGRGIRQGNDIIRDHYNNELPIYYYATEATLDAYKYQLLDTKQKFIDQGKTADAAVRDISEGEGDEENGVSFAAMTAMLSGNPVILEKAKVDKQVKELQTSSQAFQQEKYNLKDKIDFNKRQQKYAETKAAQYEKDKKLFDANAKRNEKTGELLYNATIEGEDFTERSKAGEKLLEVRKQFAADYETKYPNAKKIEYAYRSTLPDMEKVVGKLNGFDIAIRMSAEKGENNKVALYPEIGIKSPVSDISYKWSSSLDAVSLAGHLQREVRDLQSDIDSENKRASTYQKQATDQERYLASLPEEFPRQKEYDAALVRQAKVQAALQEMVTKALPTSTQLEETGKRLRSASDLEWRVVQDKLDDIYSVTEDGEVNKIATPEDYFAAREDEGTRFYEWVEPEKPDEGIVHQVKEPLSQDVSDIKDIVHDLIKEGTTSLKKIQDIAAKELGDTPATRKLITDAYNAATKEVKIADTNEQGQTIKNELTTSFAKRVNNFVDNIFGKSKDPEGHVEMRKLPDDVLGFTDNKTGKIILNDKQVNPNTPVHEAGSLWTEWAKQNDVKLYNRGIELINKSDYLDKVKESKFYLGEAAKLPEAERESYLQHEALSAAIGDKGAQFITEAKRKTFVEWAKSLWDKVAQALGFKNVTAEELQDMTFDDFTKRAAVDILKGEPQKTAEPEVKTKEEENTGQPDFTSIRKEKLKSEIAGAKELIEKRQPKTWSEVYDNALTHVQEMYPKKSLYEAMKSRVNSFVDKVDKKELYNPTSEDIAVFNVFRAQTGDRINDIDGLNSDDPTERNAALLEYEPLRQDLLNVATVVNPEGEAGRAFGMHQSEVKFDPDYGLKVRRMDLLRAKGGNPLSEDDMAWTEQKWNEQKELMRQEQEVREHGMREEFDKKLADLQAQFEDKTIKPDRTFKEKTLKQTGQELADKIRKLKTTGTTVDFTIGTWNLAVESIAKLVEGTYDLAGAIKKLIEDKTIGFKTDADRDTFENLIIDGLNKPDKNESLQRIRDYAEENGLSDVTKEMVGKGLISDYVNSHIGDVEQPDILNVATKDLKEVLPDITRKKLIEAYLKERDYKQETKKDLEGGIAEQKKQLVSIAKLEEDIQDLTELNDLRQRSFPTEREKSEYEQELFDEKKAMVEKLREERNKVAKTERDAQKREDKLAELDANIKRAEAGQELIKTYRENPDRNIDAEIAAKLKQLKKAVNDNTPDEKVQENLLKKAKENAVKKTKELQRRINEGDYEERKPKASLSKADAELFKLRKKESEIEEQFRKRQRELREANKSGLEKLADFARSVYVAFLIGSFKTLAKVGSLAGLRPLSEAFTKITLGQIYNSFFPGISRAALHGGESSSPRSIQKGFEAYFIQKGAKGIEEMAARSETAFQKADKAYNDYKHTIETLRKNNPNAKLPLMDEKLKKLKEERDGRLLGTMGNLIYQFIGGSSIKDATQALINRSNEIEKQFGKVEGETFKKGFKAANLLDQANYILGFVGRSHSALKTFSGRFSFAAGFMARLEGAVKDNQDLTGDRVLEIAHESYLDWERGKYQQDNAITTWWNNMLNAMDRKNDAVSKVASTALRFDVAITRVPVNILHEAVMEYTLGAFRAAIKGTQAVRSAKQSLAEQGILKDSEGFKEALRDQVSRMDATQAATIVRNFRKGGIGLGLYALTLILGGVHFGIFPHLGQKKKKDEELLGPEELNPGQVMLGKTKYGEIMSSVIEHIPALWPTFMGLGMAQAYHNEIQKGRSTAQAMASSAYTHLKIIEGGIPQTKLVAGLQEDVVNTIKKRLTDSGIIDKPLPNGYERADKSDPAFKYVMDKGGTLPLFSPSTIEIPDQDIAGNPVMKKLSEFPEEKVTEFNQERKANLKQSINDLMNGQQVYLNKYGKAGLEYSDDHDTPVTLEELTPEQRKEIWSLLGGKATRETKKKLLSADELQ